MSCTGQKLFSIITIVSAILLSNNASGISLRGYFPVCQGRFWNFAKTEGNSSSTWAVNGSLTCKGVGGVLIMTLEDGRFLCIREEWGGLYIYGEYGPDKYFIPEKPLLFLPSELKQGVPVEVSADLKVFSDPEGGLNFKETGKENRHITFHLKGVKDIKVDSIEFKNCVVVEKITDGQSGIASEMMWLAPLVGPVKRVVRHGSQKITYTILSYGGTRRLSENSLITSKGTENIFRYTHV